jgi:hypothetical protein
MYCSIGWPRPGRRRRTMSRRTARSGRLRVRRNRHHWSLGRPRRWVTRSARWQDHRCAGHRHRNLAKITRSATFGNRPTDLVRYVNLSRWGARGCGVADDRATA